MGANGWLKRGRHGQCVDPARVCEVFRTVGGVRLEDDVVVTARGCRVLSKVPREVADVEAVLAGAPWDLAQGAREYADGART